MWCKRRDTQVQVQGWLAGSLRMHLNFPIVNAHELTVHAPAGCRHVQKDTFERRLLEGQRDPDLLTRLL